MARAQEMIEVSAGPPPYSLSPMVEPVGCWTAVLPMVLPTPTTRGHGSSAHQPHAEPPDWPGVAAVVSVLRDRSVRQDLPAPLAQKVGSDRWARPDRLDLKATLVALRPFCGSLLSDALLAGGASQDVGKTSTL